VKSAVDARQSALAACYDAAAKSDPLLGEGKVRLGALFHRAGYIDQEDNTALPQPSLTPAHADEIRMTGRHRPLAVASLQSDSAPLLQASQ